MDTECTAHVESSSGSVNRRPVEREDPMARASEDHLLSSTSSHAFMGEGPLSVPNRRWHTLMTSSRDHDGLALEVLGIGRAIRTLPSGCDELVAF